MTSSKIDLTHQKYRCLEILQFALRRGNIEEAMQLNPHIWLLILQLLFNLLNNIRNRHIGNDDTILNVGNGIATILNAVQNIWQLLQRLTRQNERRRRKWNPHKLIQLMHGYRYCSQQKHGADDYKL